MGRFLTEKVSRSTDACAFPLETSRKYNRREPMPADLELLQGAWSVTSLELDGETVHSETLSEARIDIVGARFTGTGMGPIYEGTVRLDANVQPRQIDLHFDSGPEAGNVNHGIYELKGGFWKLCIATRGDARPAEFATSPGSGIALEILERAAKKPARKAKGAAAAISAAASEPLPTTEFEGEWRMMEAVMDGAPMDEATMLWVRRVNQGNVSTVYGGPQIILKVEFTYDAEQSPCAIDYVHLAGPNKGKQQRGVYSLRAGVLTVCMAAPGALRPRDFQTGKGDGRTFTVWKKVR
jgi:uncharacterized protein (TIGR03067 family)